MSLNEAMNAHKRAMNDNERLLDDLKKANNGIRVRLFLSIILCGCNFNSPRAKPAESSH